MDSKGEYEALLDKSNVTGYASASFISKTFWIWLNPLLKKGYKNPLKFEDVPTLSPEHKAEIMSHLFQKNWPKPEENSNHPVALTLFRCFWQQFAFTAFIALLRLCVLYIGVFLIQEFVDFASGKSSSAYAGYYLVSILLVAKFVEVLSSHQFNFHNEKLAMLIRSTLFTSLYKKSLRLSASARQAHAIPQIVDYMSVDAQQLSDITPQLHSLWLMPLHILVASIILYQYLGIATLASIAALAFVVIFVLLITKMKSICEFEATTSRGSRVRATIKMLVDMKAIKFQAWEEHFNKIIHSFRETEYGWLSVFMYSISANFIVLWSLPTVIATITYGSALLLGFPLTVGTVFTTISLLKMLQEPISAFSRSMVSLSQAIISLERLDKFMTSKELLDNTVERFEGCDGDIAVEVKDGSFSWYDEEGKEAVTNLNLEIRKGDLVAIVGEAGSGKSNLLAAILGEMNKSSGKLTICGSTAYVAQSLWIRNGTIQENILFGLPMNGERYKEAIRVCSLSKDFEMMEFGDQTEIGPDGIKLSNGQTQRIQLARAVYQDCDIYLLDDVFSAVDAHTRSYIFKECVQGALRDKTIVLVANQVDFLHNFDEILVMREGSIVQSGKYDTLLDSGLDFEALVSAHEASTEVEISEPSKGNSKPIKYEERAAERVSLGVYKLYCESFGWLGIVVVLLFLVTWQGSLMSSDYWLAYETSDEDTKLFNPLLFISVYAILAGVAFVLILMGCILVAHMGLKTSQIFFGQILLSILYAPASFVNPTSFSKILTRVSFDQTNMDISIPEFMTITLAMCITLISIIIMTCQYAWPTIILVIPLAWLSFWHRGYYISTSRELTRFDAITKARVTNHFLDSIIGITTIRCFKKQELLCNENVNRVNVYLRMGFHNSGSSGWLGFRLELMGSFILCTSALFTTVLPSNIIAPEKVGLALSYGLFINSTLYWAIHMTCLLEKNMVSLDRLKQFTIIPSEAERKKEDSLPPSNWPTRGDVEIKNLQVRHSPDTPLVLKGVSFSISGGEKIGVVGRSSTEKSALLQVLFRLVEPSGGRIIVDGIDISSLGLHDLRSRFGIIPRDAVLLEGTVRSNIDPTSLYSNDDIWEILERCQLKEFVSSMPGELDAIVSGCNWWSNAQMQLLCLGRVMLKKSRLLFVEEATVAVDSSTDGVIQKIIREDFSSSTIISIARRIPMVMDCDRVLVIDAGRAKEFDKPARLLEGPSLFGTLVQEYTNRS